MQNPQDILESKFGFKVFRPLQKTVIDIIVSGKDCVVILPTGAGKSLCYQIPALCIDGVGIIISPLVALMQNQVDALKGTWHSCWRSQFSYLRHKKNLI